MKYTLLGKAVLEDRVVNDGAVCVENGVITYAGERSGAPVWERGGIYDLSGRYIAPGFVDIHCHAGGKYWTHENPAAVAAYHKAHGTTSMLCTFYRGFTTEEYLSFFEKVKSAMAEDSVIKGVHLEGPYLNPKYGAAPDSSEKIERASYMPLAESGLVKQWTVSPEEEGSFDFISDIAKCGICPAIGHSAASPEQVHEAVKRGARLVTHLFDATGASIEPAAYDGTLEVSFSFAALLEDALSYEIICDRNSVHVRKEFVRLTEKIAGVDRIIGVTDACTGDDSDTDINIVDGELYGSKLTMDGAARNFSNIGFSMPDVFKITAKNPAEIIGLEKTGVLKEGYFADIIVINDNFEVSEVFTR